VDKSYQIKNYMEHIVFSQMKDILKDLHVCTCDKCVYDIAAIALNELPSKYIVSERGELYSKVERLMQQFEVDVMAAITKAAELVKKSPRHEAKGG